MRLRLLSIRIVKTHSEGKIGLQPTNGKIHNAVGQGGYAGSYS
jgi:hypothetical protein